MPAISRSCLAGAAFIMCAAVCAQQVETGIEQFRRGDYIAARETLRKSPDSAHRRTFLALARAATGECRQVIADLSREFERASDPDLARLAGIGLVQCHLSKNDFDAAAPVLASLQASYHGDADVLYLAARLHMRAWNDAVYQLYRSAPSSYRVNQLSAEVFETQGRYTEAVAEYRKAIEKNQAALNLHYRLGRALLMESHSPGALEAARTEFEAELKLNPNDAVAEYQVAQILLTAGQSQEAAKRFDRAVALSPDFAEALVALGKLRLSEKRYPDAVRFLERAVELQPASESARYSLMLAYRDTGRTADAARQKEALDQLQKPPEGEFSEFLKKLGEKAPRQ
jgi:tetratricopeptide (TPR) repeat protein